MATKSKTGKGGAQAPVKEKERGGQSGGQRPARRPEEARPAATAATATTGDKTAAAPAAPAAKAPSKGASAGASGISAAPFGLAAPSEADPYLQPVGFCIERRLQDNGRGITAMSFAPDGRLFLAFDSDLAHEVDPLILYDAYHPSRSIAIYDPASGNTPVEIMAESTRITGLDWADGSLYVSRAGEVGRIPDGGHHRMAGLIQQPQQSLPQQHRVVGHQHPHGARFNHRCPSGRPDFCRAPMDY